MILKISIEDKISLISIYLIIFILILQSMHHVYINEIIMIISISYYEATQIEKKH